MNRSNNESPLEHFHSSGLALIAIGTVMMIMSAIMIFSENPESEYDHVSNFLMGLIVLLCGIWLFTHNEEDVSD